MSDFLHIDRGTDNSRCHSCIDARNFNWQTTYFQSRSVYRLIIIIIIIIIIIHDKLHARCSLLFGESMSPKFSAGFDIRSRPACKLPAVSEICSHLRTQGSWVRKHVDLTRCEFLTCGLERAASQMPGETHSKNPKRKFIANAAHCTGFPTWGSWARRLKDPQEKHILYN